MKHKTITIIPILIALQVVAAVMTTGRYSQQMKQIKADRIADILPNFGETGQ